MTEDEYSKKKTEIEKENRKKLLVLDREYAFANSPVSIGNVIEDHSCKIKVDEIKFSSGGIMRRLPECVYSGPRLKKNNKPFMSGERDTIYQSNLKE